MVGSALLASMARTVIESSSVEDHAVLVVAPEGRETNAMSMRAMRLRSAAGTGFVVSGSSWLPPVPGLSAQ